MRERDGGGADEGAVGAEGAGDDARAARELEAAARVDLGLRGGEERLAEAERDRTRDDREVEVEQVRDRSRPRGRRACPCASTISGGASAGGRPVMRAIAVPDASASRQPRAPHPHSCPSGSTMTWPMWPALPVGAVEQAAVEHDAAADAGRDDHAEVVVAAARRADPTFAERERLGVVVDEHRQAGVLGERAPATGSRATRGC